MIHLFFFSRLLPSEWISIFYPSFRDLLPLNNWLRICFRFLFGTYLRYVHHIYLFLSGNSFFCCCCCWFESIFAPARPCDEKHCCDQVNDDDEQKKQLPGCQPAALFYWATTKPQWKSSQCGTSSFLSTNENNFFFLICCPLSFKNNSPHTPEESH